MPHKSFRRSSCVDDVDVEVVPDGVVVVVGVLLDARVALTHAVRAQPRVAPLQARSPAVPEVDMAQKLSPGYVNFLHLLAFSASTT